MARCIWALSDEEVVDHMADNKEPNAKNFNFEMEECLSQEQFSLMVVTLWSIFKGGTTTEPTAACTTTTPMDSAVLQFRLDYEQVKRLSVDDVVCSEAVSVGQHLWRIDCYPRGPEKYSDKDNGNYVSLYLRHMSSSRSVHAIFDAFLMDGNGDPSEARKTTRLHKFEIKGDPLRRDDWGCHRFVARTVLEENYVIDGHITFVCTVIVMRDTPVTVPPSDIGNQLGCLLDQPHGTDVSFTVDGETFPANRAILAARSPVFKAELFGSMAEAAMSSITLHDIRESLLALKTKTTVALRQHPEFFAISMAWRLRGV
nr:BTB/POZ and MATH domain-containing protein 2-like [Aegilops tauschii subsp. strangulata]